MKMSKIERFYQTIFPVRLHRLVLALLVLVVVLEIACPDFMAKWDIVLLCVVVPYVIIQFWLSGYFKGRIDSEKEERNREK
jgi:hypothetical protein